MATITLIIEDLPKGRGFNVRTDALLGTVGRQYTPAEAFAQVLLRRALFEANHVDHGATLGNIQGGEA